MHVNKETQPSESKVKKANIASMVEDIDVSQAVWLRKRLGRAQLATKVAGVVAASALVAMASEISHGVGVLALSISLAAGAVWGAGRLARGLREGNSHAAKLLGVGFVPYTAGALYETVRLIMRPDLLALSFIHFLHFGIWVGSVYFIARGLLAFRAITRLPPEQILALTLLSSPFESGAKVLRPRVFPNKGIFVLLMLFFLFAWACIMLPITLIWMATMSWPFFLLFQSVFDVPSLLFATFFYRMIRHRAVSRATDVLRKHDRAPVLYLRSFGDDKLKLRARPANGRTWLDSVFRVGFEEVVVDHLFRYGPVVAIGRPLSPLSRVGTVSSTQFYLRHLAPLLEAARKHKDGGTWRVRIAAWMESALGRIGSWKYSVWRSRLPWEIPLGAARDYLTGDAWQARVADLMEQALLIVVVLGRTEGLSWEIGQLVRSGLTQKLVFLLPPVDGSDFLARWGCLRDHFEGMQAGPSKVDLRRARAVLPPGWHEPGSPPLVILAEDRDDWSYETALGTAATLVTAREGTESLRLPPVGLAGIPTVRTDWTGRTARFLALSSVVGAVVALLTLALSFAGWLFGPSAVIAGVAFVFLAAGHWTFIARYLPGVDLREHVFASIAAAAWYSLLVLTGGELHRRMGLWVFLFSAGFGIYIGVRRDRTEQRARRAWGTLGEE